MGFFDKLFRNTDSDSSESVENYKTLFNYILSWKENGECPFNEMYVWCVKKSDGYYLRIIFWWHYCGRSGISLFSENRFWKLIVDDFGFVYNDTDFADNCFVSESIKIQNVSSQKAIREIKEFSERYSTHFDELKIFP